MGQLWEADSSKEHRNDICEGGGRALSFDCHCCVLLFRRLASVYPSLDTSLSARSLTSPRHNYGGMPVKFVSSMLCTNARYGHSALLAIRWEVEKECMPYKSSSRWRPHTSLQSPWSAVYAAMGLASWLVWRQGGFAAQSTPLGLYGGLLIAVYLAWPPAFVSGNKLYAAVDAVGEAIKTFLPQTLSILAQYLVNITS